MGTGFQRVTNLLHSWTFSAYDTLQMSERVMDSEYRLGFRYRFKEPTTFFLEMGGSVMLMVVQRVSPQTSLTASRNAKRSTHPLNGWLLSHLFDRCDCTYIDKLRNHRDKVLSDFSLYESIIQ